MRLFCIAALAVGCSFEEEKEETGDLLHRGGDSEDTGAWGSCEDNATEVGLEEVTALGFSAADVVLLVAGPTTQSARWTTADAATVVSLAVSSGSTATFHDQEPVEGSGPDDACEDFIEFSASIAFSTADGGFDEHVDGRVAAWTVEEATASADLDWGALGGTWSVEEEIDPAEWDDVSLELLTLVSTEGLRGEVALSAHRSDGETGKAFTGAVLLWPDDD